MKTIHIKNFTPLLEANYINTDDIPKLKELVKELYEYCLKDDPKFHFFFEPEIIIRIHSQGCLSRLKSYLSSKNIEFEEYNYPFPPPGKFGEEPDGIVARNLELFLAVFHANSVAALTLSEEDHFKYIERLVHTAFNPRFFPHDKEGTWLLNLALLKLGKEKIQEILSS